MEFWQYDFMQRALLAAVLVGLAAPAVGTFVVQRRLALIGDGMGHVALTGVAIGLLTGRSPVVVALAVAIAGAVVIELLRARGRTSGDIALALLFYGGIAGGVVLISAAPGGTATLNAYLFGAITTTSTADLVVFGLLTAVVLLLTVGLGRPLFAVANDEEHAVAIGLPVRLLNLLLAVLVAATVVLSMRVVGLLLISALMVVPVATATQLAGSFRTAFVGAVGVGVIAAIGGVVGSFYLDTPSGGTIVLVALAGFVLTLILGRLTGRAVTR